MKVNISRETAQVLVDRLDGIDTELKEPERRELNDFRDRLSRSLDQSAAMQKLTPAELDALLFTIQGTKWVGQNHMAGLASARPKLQAMLALAQKEADDGD